MAGTKAMIYNTHAAKEGLTLEQLERAVLEMKLAGVPDNAVVMAWTGFGTKQLRFLGPDKTALVHAAGICALAAEWTEEFDDYSPPKSVGSDLDFQAILEKNKVTNDAYVPGGWTPSR